MKKLSRGVAAVAVLGLVGACSDLLGLHDFALDPEYGADGGGSDAGGADTGGPDAGGGADVVVPTDGSAVDSPPDTGCGDTTSDPKNCGACGHDCLGSQCVASACQPIKLAYGFIKILSITVDSTNLYWLDNDFNNGGVYECPKASCAATEITSDNGPAGITQDSQGIYWGHSVQPGEVDWADGDGGLFTVVPYADFPEYVVTDTNGVYWANSDTAPNGSVAFSPRAGGTDAGTILASGYGEPSGIDLSGGILYWSVYDDGTLRSCPLPGCLPVTTYTVGGSPRALVVDGTTMYWTNEVLSTGGVFAAPSGDASAPLALGQNLNNPLSVRFDTTDVYWVNGGDPTGTDGSIMRCAKTGCASPTTLASGLAFPTDLVLDGPWIYYVTQGDGTVWKLAK